MSTNEGANNTQEANKPRRTNYRRRRAPKSDDAAAATSATATGGAESAPRRTRQNVPIPTELVGVSSTGTITDVITRGRSRFGFINVGADENSREVPRVYFNLVNYDAEQFRARRGYPVEFTVNTDESGKFFATGVKLTAEGHNVAIARETKIAERRAAAAATAAAAPAAPAADAEGAKRRTRRRRPQGGGESSAAAAASSAEGASKPRTRNNRRNRDAIRKLTVHVTCEGHEDVRDLTIDIANNVGKLKYAATELFGAPKTHSVYHKEVFLSKLVLKELKDGETIHLKPSPESNEA